MSPQNLSNLVYLIFLFVCLSYADGYLSAKPVRTPKGLHVTVRMSSGLLDSFLTRQLSFYPCNFDKITLRRQTIRPSSLFALFSNGISNDPQKFSIFKIIGAVVRDIIDAATRLFGKLRDSRTRQIVLSDFRSEVSSRWTSLTRNMTSGNSKEMSIPQLLLFATIFLGLPPIISFFIQLSGIAFALWGLYLILDGSWSLRENISLYVSPVAGNFIVMDRSYSSVVHPIYGGVVLLSLGVSLVTNSVDKMFTTLILYFVLVS